MLRPYFRIAAGAVLLVAAAMLAAALTREATHDGAWTFPANCAVAAADEAVRP